MNTSKKEEQKENETERKWSVYVHINKINNKKYVGITSRNPEVRWQHGTAYRHNPHFNSAIEKYGWDNFEHIVLHSDLTHDEACQCEKYYIRKYNSKDNAYGYNMTDGGEGMYGYKFDQSTIEKMRENNTGSNNPMYGRKGSSHPMYGRCGELSPMYGRNHTEETKRIMRQRKVGVKLSESHKLHLRQSAHRGKDNVRSVPVSMFSLDGELLKSFSSITEAAMYCNGNCSNIRACCIGKNKTSMGYVWKYTSEITNIMLKEN